MSICVICGARVVNANPRTKTCSTPCTDKLHERENADEVRRKLDDYYRQRDELWDGPIKKKFLPE